MSFNMVIQGLWVGDLPSSTLFDGERLCVLETRCATSHYWIPILEHGLPASIERLNEAADLITQVLNRGARLLVHCGAGIERSPLTCAWWMRRTGLYPTLSAAYEKLIQVRPEVANRVEWLPPAVRLP